MIRTQGTQMMEVYHDKATIWGTEEEGDWKNYVITSAATNNNENREV